MTLRPSRVVEQMRGIPFFVGKSSSNCSVCGRPLTAHESVARGIGPVCVRKHMGPGPHPSGSPQSVHAGKWKGRKSLADLVRETPVGSRQLADYESGQEPSSVNFYEDGTKALVKRNEKGSADSELLAYEFSESIGWGIVPETVVPKSGGFAANESVQRWVEGETYSIMLGSLAKIEMGGKSDQIVIMDELLQNRDRHGNNIVIDSQGKQWAIDNNRAFDPSWPGGKLSYRHYGSMYPFGRRVTKDRAGLIDAAKDVRRWSETPAYREYVAKLEKTHGKAVARQFGLNVADLVDWSRKAKVVE